MFNQETTSEASLSQNKSKVRGLIRVPQGKICRIEIGNQDYDGLCTDDFSSCNIIVVHNKQKMSVIHADSSIDLAAIESEKKWVGEGVNVKIFFKKNGIAVYKQIFGIAPKIKSISETTKAISAKFVDGIGFVEALADKPEKMIRHPQESRLETTHKINVAFFYLLHPAYRFDEKIKIQWKEQVSKLVFDGEFWTMPNAHACDLHATVFAKIAGFSGKSSEEMQGKIYQKMSGSVQNKMDKMSESEKTATLERMTRTSLSVAETIWCYYNEYRLHDDTVDSKTINEAYDNIKRKREEIKIKCQKIYDSQTYADIVANFKILKPFIKKFFCKEEGIVLALEHKNISFIDFMERRISEPLSDTKQLLEFFDSTIVPADAEIVVERPKVVMPKAPVKLPEVALLLPVLIATPVVSKPVENNEASKKLVPSDFPLVQAKKAAAHDTKQESEDEPWLPAPTRKKPANSFLSAWESTPAKSTAKKIVPAVAESRNSSRVPPLRNDRHFPALSKIRSDSN